jgi:hypothetical protein
VELFAFEQQGVAQQGINNQAFQAGLIIGIIIAVIVSSSIPLSVGMKRGHPVLGTIGALFSGAIAVPFGCLGGLPMAGLFAVIIMCLPKPDSGRRRRRRRDDDYEDDSRDDDEHDYSDRPPRQRPRDW